MDAEAQHNQAQKKQKEKEKIMPILEARQERRRLATAAPSK
jgi:hypothetical protein